jgi:hypothetical protein
VPNVAVVDAACTVAVGAADADAEPPLFDAVTVTSNVAPTSAPTTV